MADVPVVDADGRQVRALTGDARYRDEYPQWSNDGTMLLFARFDGDDRASVWLLDLASGATMRLAEIDVGGETDSASGWFGYYGTVAWPRAFSWWQAGGPGR